MLEYYPYGLEFSSPSLEEISHFTGDMTTQTVMEALNHYLKLCLLRAFKEAVLEVPTFKIIIMKLPHLEMCLKISSVKCR